jgi:hypothetical protein
VYAENTQDAIAASINTTASAVTSFGYYQKLNAKVKEMEKTLVDVKDTTGKILGLLGTVMEKLDQT